MLRLPPLSRWVVSLAWAAASIPMLAMSVSASTPPAREHFAAAWDGARDRMIAFGGQNQAPLNETWVLTSDSPPSWQLLSTPGRCLEWIPVAAGQGPSPRSRQSMVYDSNHHRLILFGGKAGFTRLNDVWIKQVSTDSAWIQVAPAGASPSERYSAATIYDPVRNRVLVFGGNTASGVSNDLWALDLSATPAWTQLTPAGPAPATRFGA